MPTGARPWAARASRTLFPREAELVKKFDDDRGASRSSPLLRSAGGSRNYLWRPSIVPPRRALKRLALIALAAAAVYLFVANIPTDVPVRDRRRPVYRHPEPGSGDAGRGGRAGQVGGGRGDDLFGIGHGSQGGVVGELPLRPGGIGGSGGRQHQGQGRGGGAKNSAGPGGVIKDENSDRTYNGPVTFPGLSGSIQAIGMTGGVYTSNKNVMFAAASMRSVTALLPLACQMGMERRSYVHFVLMGRSTISVTDLLALNGVDDLCLVIFHGKAWLAVSSGGTC